MKTRTHVTDIVDQPTRSRMMSGIRGKNTGPELALRRALHARGFRFRLHSKKVYGKPDVVLPKYRSVVFINGCFWHRHEGCRFSSTPSTRPEFWRAKFEATIARDAAVRKKLLEDRWRVATVWECTLTSRIQIGETADALCKWLVTDTSEFELGDGKQVELKDVT